MTYQVIYSSMAAEHLSLSDLESILVDAREGNKRRGITGALVFVEDVFLQILEGDRDAVQRLMSSIEKDPRHSELHVISESEIDQPMFTAWKMAHLSPAPEQIAAWLGKEGTASVQELKLTPFRGHLILKEEGVRHGKNQAAVSGRIQTADC